MSFLGIGPGELLLIIILLLVVVGPERLPGVARTVGRNMVRVRNWLQTSPDAALVLHARQELELELAQLKTSLLEVQSVRDEVLGVAKHLDEAVSPITNARASLADLIKAPLDQTLPRTSNGQAAGPAADIDQQAPAANDLAAADTPTAPPVPAADLPNIIQATQGAPDTLAAPATAIEDVRQHLQALTADIHASQAQAHAEAALRSAQIEALMADMHELQQQLKARGLLAVDWQPPSWSVHMPGQEQDTQIEEADR
jgi:sec-independent protein translocase protein TatB